MWTPELRGYLRTYLAPRTTPLYMDAVGDVSQYMLIDATVDSHCRTGYGSQTDTDRDGSCDWVIPDGALLGERTLDHIDNPSRGVRERTIVVVSGVHCACKKYKNTTVFYDGSLADLFAEAFGLHGGSIRL